MPFPLLIAGAVLSALAGGAMILSASDRIKNAKEQYDRRLRKHRNSERRYKSWQKKADAKFSALGERKGALEQFYSLLHRAVDTGNDQQLQTALSGILGIIQENPLKDFAEFKKNMADPNFVLEV